MAKEAINIREDYLALLTIWQIELSIPMAWKEARSFFWKLLVFGLMLTGSSACDQSQTKVPPTTATAEPVFSTLVAQPEMVVKNKKLLDAIHAYSQYVEKSTLKLVVEQRGPQVSMRIEPVISFFPSANEAPSFYFEERGKLVMVYTGLEKIMAVDSTLLKTFRKTLGSKLGKLHLGHAEPDDEQTGPFYDPQYWRFILEDDSVIIQKTNVFSPSVPEPIEVIPPYKDQN